MQTNGALRFTWNSTTGLVYQVQFKTNLTQTKWINLGNAITATNSTATAFDLSNTNQQRFYRVRIVP